MERAGVFGKLKSVWIVAAAGLLLAGLQVPAAQADDAFNLLMCSMSGGVIVDGVCVKEEPGSTPVAAPVCVQQRLSLSSGKRSEESFKCEDGGVSVNPLVMVDNPPAGPVDFYAGYLINGRLHIAETDLGGGISFPRSCSGDRILPFASGELSGSEPYEWVCTAFEGLGELDVETLKENAVWFFVGLAPKGDISKMQVAIFKFE